MKTLQYMRFAAAALACAALMWVVTACRHSDLWSEMPAEISLFVTHYFPFQELQSFDKGAATYHVRIDDGPGLTFDSECAWIAIDGYGMPLPQVLLFDQLPPKVYDYLQETEQVGGVFSMERDKMSYTLTLLDDTLTYYIDSGELTLRKPAS
ncbi:MAG: hypothetical protein K2L28_09365 [Muribaculaceae bacterium]|nr:hypothetical protein [Muribaculaceae bacterium]